MVKLLEVTMPSDMFSLINRFEDKGKVGEPDGITLHQVLGKVNTTVP